MLRGIVNDVPTWLLLIAAVAAILGVVVLLVWLIRRLVPAVAEGFDAEVSSQMLGVVAALFGLLFAFIIVIAYQNYTDAQSNVTGEADASLTVIDYVAAASGLIVVALQIGYLPTLYGAFNRRETEVTLLSSRAGAPAWGPEILARTLWGISEGDTGPVLGDLFRSWERWSAELAESHTTYVVLVRLRSPRPLSHWLTALLAVMDAAALHLAIAPAREPKLPARLLLRMGFTALEQIARAVGIAVPQEADPDAPISISYEQFQDAVEELRRLGYPVERTSEQAWPHFRGWRANYDIAALGLARELDAPPAMWSGPRRWPSQPVASARPALRIAREAAQGSQTQPKSPGS